MVQGQNQVELKDYLGQVVYVAGPDIKDPTGAAPPNVHSSSVRAAASAGIPAFQFNGYPNFEAQWEALQARMIMNYIAAGFTGFGWVPPNAPNYVLVMQVHANPTHILLGLDSAGNHIRGSVDSAGRLDPLAEKLANIVSGSPFPPCAIVWISRDIAADDAPFLSSMARRARIPQMGSTVHVGSSGTRYGPSVNADIPAGTTPWVIVQPGTPPVLVPNVPATWPWTNKP